MPTAFILSCLQQQSQQPWGTTHGLVRGHELQQSNAARLSILLVFANTIVGHISLEISVALLQDCRRHPKSGGLLLQGGLLCSTSAQTMKDLCWLWGWNWHSLKLNTQVRWIKENQSLQGLKVLLATPWLSLWPMCKVLYTCSQSLLSPVFSPHRSSQNPAVRQARGWLKFYNADNFLVHA